MFFIALLLIALLPSAHATTLQRFGLEELVHNAERIVVAVCQKSESVLVNGRIYTHYSFTIGETVKGNGKQTLELHLPGGQSQGLQSRIAGMPTFAVGEEIVLFLTEKNQLGHAWPVGLGQGTFRIERSEDQAARVYQNLDGLSFYEGAAKRAKAEEPIQGSKIGIFLERLRALDKATPHAH
ncbi:MAG: hypothetical protein ACKVJG_04395 [Candidatus Latescibacterota bacterium]|jgi:hypothetical protein